MSRRQPPNPSCLGVRLKRQHAPSRIFPRISFNIQHSKSTIQNWAAQPPLPPLCASAPLRENPHFPAFRINAERSRGEETSEIDVRRQRTAQSFSLRRSSRNDCLSFDPARRHRPCERPALKLIRAHPISALIRPAGRTPSGLSLRSSLCRSAPFSFQRFSFCFPRSLAAARPSAPPPRPWSVVREALRAAQARIMMLCVRALP